ncbi:MAG TPA: CAP domain-containing protein [Sphingomicrobium sp.]|nr:CAP domain-containing protein [Sphingomicrobium sp.]
MVRAPYLVAAAAFATAVPASAQQLDGATGALAQRLLAAHNRERALVGAPPLQWDPQLAADAASYGPTLASLGHLVHSPRDTRPGERENLAMAWHATLSPEQLVEMWSREKLLLEPGLFPDVSRTGQWQDVAHYTQMVWPTTTHVGCAIYAADWDYLICRYSPPGNKDGKPVFVQAAATAASTGSR